MTDRPALIQMPDGRVVAMPSADALAEAILHRRVVRQEARRLAVRLTGPDADPLPRAAA